MAGMFYSLKEAAEKLKKTEQEVQNLVKEGRLREFRDGAKLLFKVGDVDVLAAGTENVPADVLEETPAVDRDEILLAPEAGDAVGLSDGDTAVPGKSGIQSKTGSSFKFSDDLMGETNVTVVPDSKSALTGSGSSGASLEEVEGDVNLDSFGSGSGLLDLSLQADDTSLGGILDEIYTADGSSDSHKSAPAPAGSAADVVAEADQMLADEPEPQLAMPVVVQSYAEPAPDAVSNAMGIVMFLPLAAVLYATIVSLAGFDDVVPLIVKISGGIVWYIMAGLIIAAGVIIGFAFMAGGSAAKSKIPRIKKEKPSGKNEKAAEVPEKPV